MDTVFGHSRHLFSVKEFKKPAQHKEQTYEQIREIFHNDTGGDQIAAKRRLKVGRLQTNGDAALHVQEV